MSISGGYLSLAFNATWDDQVQVRSKVAFLSKVLVFELKMRSKDHEKLISRNLADVVRVVCF